MTTEAKKRAIKKYNAKTYTEIKLRIRKEEAERMKEHIAGRSINGFINEAIREKIERESEA